MEGGIEIWCFSIDISLYSKTIQDTVIITMKDEYELVCARITNDLE